VDDFGAATQLRSHGLVPIYRGEVIPAVAAASVVARATFLIGLRSITCLREVAEKLNRLQ